jgi:hypothetical protein
MKIRNYKEEVDFLEIERWARIDPGIEISKNELSPTTFIVESTEAETIMVAALSLLLTNSKFHCIPEGLYSNPDLIPGVRKQAMEMLLFYVEAFASALEYKGLFCIPINERMGRHFEKRGFKLLRENVSTMHKEIGG